MKSFLSGIAPQWRSSARWLGQERRPMGIQHQRYGTVVPTSTKQLCKQFMEFGKLCYW